MSAKKLFSLTAIGLIIVVILTSCGIAQPSGVPSEDSINTSVAATVNSQFQPTNQPVIAVTPDLPTSEPTAVPEPSEAPNINPLAVAFVSPEHNAYFWNESLSAPVQLTTSGDVQSAIVSPDGTQVVLVRTMDWISYSLDLVNSDGSGMFTLIPPAGFDVLPRPADTLNSAPAHVSWVPGTDQVALSTRIVLEGPGTSNGSSLYLINTNNGTLTTLMDISSSWSWDYEYSPDGSRIAVSRPEGVDLYSSDGTLLVKNVITYPFVNTASEYAWLAKPIWAPDGNAFVAIVPPQDPWASPPADSSVWYWESGASAAVMKFRTPMTYWPMEIAAVSPDLAKILYLVRSGEPEENLYALKLINIDGSGTQEIAIDQIYNLPDWSTDGSKFYFHSDTGGAILGNLDGSLSSLPAFSQVRNVSWIDSEQFIGSAGSGTSRQLLLGSTTAPPRVIYSVTSSGDQITFTINQ